MKIQSTLLVLLSCFVLSAPLQADANFDALIQEHIKLLCNLDTTNPPLIILFSATPGMGKTTLANKIQDALGAIKITLDDARILLKKHAIPVKGTTTYSALPVEEKIDCIVRYLDQLIGEVRKISKNQLIIIDDSVNEWYNKIKVIAEKNESKTFLIRLDVAKATAIERIKKREAEPQGYLNSMDRWYNAYEKFDLTLVDYVINNDSAFNDKSLRKLLRTLKAAVKQ